MRIRNQQRTLSDAEVLKLLRHWYGEFQNANCSLGYAAEQLGIKQVDFIYLLSRTFLSKPSGRGENV
jgi:hypothetical protein